MVDSLDSTTIHATSDFNLMEALAHLRHWLPSQRVIKDFIHHNTLHAFEHLNFDEAVRKAATVFGANFYLPLEEYRALAQAGKIRDENVLQEIDKLLAQYHLTDSQNINFRNLIKAALWEYQEFPDLVAIKKYLKQNSLSFSDFEVLFETLISSYVVEPSPFTYPRTKLIKTSQIHLDHLVNPILFRLIGSYLDQGICLQLFPHGKVGFYSAVIEIIRKSIFPLAPFVKKKDLEDYFDLNVETAALGFLNQLCPLASRQDYLQECLLSHPGWSGMVATLEENPEQLPDPRPICLIDFVAVKLLLESQALKHGIPNDRTRVIRDPESEQTFSVQRHTMALAVFLLKCGIKHQELDKQLTIVPKILSIPTLSSTWQKAMENSLYESSFCAIASNAKRNSSLRDHPTVADITAVFCIDDRECSIRRYLEEDPNIQTKATAGFFGLDFLFQSIYDSVPVKLCPIQIKPNHLVIEKQPNSLGHSSTQRSIGVMKILWKELSFSLFLGWLVTTLSSPWIFISLIIRVFKPTLFSVFFQRSPVQKNSELSFTYSHEEMADRILNQLNSTGLIKNMTPLIVMIAHGSSSVNNPHFAAYDCGACSGRPGAANAKAFAKIANLPEVRQLLKSKNVPIPENTYFIGAFHNTSTDTLTFFDEDNLSPFHNELLKKFKKVATTALLKNTKERSRRFDSIPLSAQPSIAAKEVRHRSFGIFEPRPEMNHATNALCIIGRRYLTKHLFLDRRAFLQSYNPTLDTDGDLLKGILSAVIPVCVGINLEYLFSRIDNETYGSGTKLPHNVASLIGVMNGIDGDLRTGLPQQMVEIHDPVRCLFVVEQNSNELLQFLNKNTDIARWFDKQWAFLAAVDPETLAISHYVPELGFETVPTETVSVPIITDVSAYVSNSRDNLPFGLISPIHSVRS